MNGQGLSVWVKVPRNYQISELSTGIISMNQLPLALCGDPVTAVLDISQANAYGLMHSNRFPSPTISKRKAIPKDNLIRRINQHICDAQLV